MVRLSLMFNFLLLLLPLTQALAGEPLQVERHELMEGVRDGAKPIAKMMKGEQEFDASVVMASFRTWSDAASVFGDMFPEGSETGYDTEARETIWSDREGFNAELASFSEAVDAAIVANPQDLEAMKPVAGAVFKRCKSCHEGYRVEDEE